MYTLTSQPDQVQRDADGAFIPFDPGNRDFIEFCQWREAGNEPKPYIPPPPPEPTLDPWDIIRKMQAQIAALEAKP